MPTDAATLRASLERHNDTFESLLKLIPAKYYIAQDNEEQVCTRMCMLGRRRIGGAAWMLTGTNAFTDSLKISKTQQETKGAQASS